MAAPSGLFENDDGKPPFISQKPPSPITFEQVLPWSASDNQEYAWRKPEYDVRITRYIDKTLPELKEMFGDDGSTIGLIIIYGFEAVERLKRFVDRRQTKLTEKPDRDGTNLCPSASEQQKDENLSWLDRINFEPPGKRALRRRQPRQPWGHQPEGSEKIPFIKRVYDFYVDWLTFLHYNTLVKLDPATRSKKHSFATMDRSRLDEFYDDLSLAPRELLEAEKIEQLEQRRDPTPQPEPGFEWVWNLEQVLPDALASVIAARRWSAQRHESLRYGEAQAWDSIPPMVRLILILLAKEHEFEYSMTCDHVDDVAYDKRVIIISAKQGLSCGIDGLVELTNTFGPPLREEITKMQRQLREVHDFRLLRDWGYGRPWKRLFVLLDTTTDRINTDKLGYRSLSDCIKEFVAHLNSSRKAYDLFDFHPIDIEDHNREDSCTICMSEFEPNGSMMQLWCSHWFHPTCILGYWDVEDRYIYSCPNCRHSPPSLSERVQFHAEKDDDYITHQDRAAVDPFMESDIRRARRNGLPYRRLSRQHRIYLLQQELSRINAQRRERERKDEERGFPTAP